MEGRYVFTVSEMNQFIKELLDNVPPLQEVLLRGEISNYKVYPSGHHYFTLKDSQSSLKCVMFKTSTMRLRFRPENGMQVIAAGRISVYPRDGAYQLYCTGLTPEGVGDLSVAFEQLKEKLRKEGLFDAAHKRPLPVYPRRIAIVTSPAGAAVHDMIRILRRRYPLAKVLLLPVRVQGTEAPAEIAGAIRYANRHALADVLITGRGGGSLEDLWAFNEEQVAWAIFNAETPIISATGHEIDTTVADMVADRRESNPSTAVMHALPVVAETVAGFDRRLEQLTMLISGRIDRLVRSLDGYDRQLRLLSPSGRLDSQRQQLDRIEKQINELMADKIEDRSMRCDRLHDRMKSAMVRKYDMTRNALAVMTERIHGLSPTAKLINGFGYISSDGEPVRSVAGITPGDDIEITLHDGRIQAVVADVTGQEE